MPWRMCDHACFLPDWDRLCRLTRRAPAPVASLLLPQNVRTFCLELPRWLQARPQDNRDWSTDALLTVPRYRNVVQAQDDENTGLRVPAMVSTAAGWRAVMNKWVADAQAAAANEGADTVAEDAEDVG